MKQHWLKKLVQRVGICEVQVCRVFVDSIGIGWRPEYEAALAEKASAACRHLRGTSL